MNDTLLIQQVYPKMGYLNLLSECFWTNARYCEENEIDYAVFVREERKALYGGWDKVAYVKDALEKYKLVIWMDVDAIIRDTSRDLKAVPNPPDTIGAVRFLLPAPHFNVGVLYFRAGERVKKFVSDWLDQYPGKGAWAEQMVFNSMKNETIYSLPAEWNKNYDMNPNANPIVLGFHGFGSWQKRLELMRNFINQEEARKSGQKPEVSNAREK